MFRRRSPTKQSFAPQGEYLCKKGEEDEEEEQKSGRVVGVILLCSLCLALMVASVFPWSNGPVGSVTSSLRALSLVQLPAVANNSSRKRKHGKKHAKRKKKKQHKKKHFFNLHDASYDDLWQKHKCDDHFSSAQPARSMSSWMFMRGIYQGLRLDATPTKDIAPRPSLLLEDTGMLVPYYIHEVDEKGRGVFAKETIPKGTKVYTSKHGGHIRFRRGMDFKSFVASVPRAMSCEILQCAAVQSLEHPARPETSVITVDLDDTCYVNTADNEDNDDGENIANAGCPKGYGFNCIDNGYALRDIQAGEEIQCDYETFAIEDGWEWFSL